MTLKRKLALVLAAGLLGAAAWAATQYASNWQRFLVRVAREFARQPLAAESVLEDSDLAGLPAPFRKYLVYSGSIGKPRVRNFRAACDVAMTRKPGAPPMPSQSLQYNFTGDPARFFFMRSSLFGLPFRVLHAYAEQKATFVVRVFSLFNLVDLSGDQLSKTETVTVLNDLCVFAPAALIDPRCDWKETGPLSARVTFTNDPYTVSADLIFNAAGELVNFVSEDRSALQDDGSLRLARWSTPLGEYREFEGRKVATYGEAVWNYPEGDFTYGRFSIKSVRYNLESPLDH